MVDCGHTHTHTHNEHTGRLLTAFAVIATFMVVEVVGGLISGSLALLADAVHMMTDAFALGLAASAQWISGRPADNRLHFGYRRTQVLAAFINGVALVVLLSWIIYEAVRRFMNPVEVDWQPMLWVALAGLAANAVAFRVLHPSSADNINVRGAMLHVISDLFGSAAAVLAAIIIAQTGWMRIDPLLSIAVAILIARSAFRLLRDTGHILLEGAPSHIKVADVIADLEASSEGVDIHNVQIWQLTPDHPRMTLHARLAGDQDPAAALALLKSRLDTRFGVRDSTIQLEFGDCCADAGDNEDIHEMATGTRTQPAHGHGHGHDHPAVVHSSRPVAGG